MDLLTLLNNIENSDLFKRMVRNIKTDAYEQQTISYTASLGVTVNINGGSIVNVVQCCIVFKNGLYYLYLQYLINAGNVSYVKYAVDDIISISFPV